MSVRGEAGAAQHDAVEDLPPRCRERAQQLLLQFGRLGTTVSGALRSRVPEADATRTLEVLVVTWLDVEGPQRPADVGGLTGMTSGGVTKLLDRLEEKGLITRTFGQVPGDRRAIVVGLTPEGHRTAGLLAAGLASRMDDIREAADELARFARD
jgi:DNA-binding MarR family transcriptional regulator